jgi:hypothetical protein
LTLNEGSGLQTVNLSGISSGASNQVQTLSVTATSSNPGLIPNPTVNYASPSSTGTLTFTPAAFAYGSATISVTVNNGGSSNNTVVRSFTVTVNQVNYPPTLNPISNLTLNENAGLQTVNLSGITSGASNQVQTLTVTATSSNPSLVPNPTVNYASPNATGSLTFTPAAFAYGSATISVTVNNGGSTNNTVVQSFTVTVNPVNYPPTLNPISNLTINEGSGLQTVNLSGISSGASNQVQTLTVTATSSNPSLIPNPTVNYTSPNATGSLTFTPAAFAYGSATISVTVNNGGSSNNTVAQSFTVTVNPVNYAPTLDPIGNLTINENAGLQTVNLTGISSGASNQVQTLSVTATSSNPSLIPNPTVSYTSPNSTGTLTFTPAAFATGSSTIAITVNNAGASNNTVVRSFTVTVNPVNYAPTLDPIGNLTINENAGLQTVNLTGISSGASNQVQTLSVTATSSDPSLVPNPTVNYTSPNSTGTLTFTPAASVSGSSTIVVTVNNGGLSNNTVVRSFTVTVNAVNYPPTLDPISDLTIDENSGTQTVDLTGISSGSAQNQTITVTAYSSNPNLIPNPNINYTSPNPNALLTFTPAPNAFGSVTMTVMVDNGGTVSNTVIRSFTVTVNLLNNPPTLDALSDLTILENSGSQTVYLSGISSGATNEMQPLTVTATSSNPNLIPNPTVAYTSPNPTGTLTFSPVTNAFGSAQITVTVDDGQPTNNTITRSFAVSVTQTNSAPNTLTNAVVAPNTAFRLPLVSPYNNSDKISFSLGSGAPAGVKIATHRGASFLNWVPTAAQALTTNLITVILTDSTNPTLNTNELVLVTVLDYLALTMGNTSVQAGQSATVPIYLSSSSGVTNLSFTVDWPTARFTNPALFIAVPGIATSSVQTQSTNLLFGLQTAAGKVLQKSNLIAQLNFQTVSNQSSAFINLTVRNISASKPDSSLYMNYVPTAGQVAVVSDKPLLGAYFDINTNRVLTAFGNVGATYVIQSSTNPTVSSAWTPVTSYTQTNISQNLPVDASSPFIFYRLLVP